MVRDMRAHLFTLALLVACGSPANPTVPTTATSAGASASSTKLAPPQPERLSADAKRTTVDGNTFLAPAGWTIAVRGRATILEAPEAGSRIALVDVQAKDADAAVAAAWAEYKP